MRKILSLAIATTLSATTFSVMADADLKAANRLADAGIIVEKTSRATYRLDDNVLRQEVIGTAVKLSGTTLPSNYNCKGYYSDLTSTSPNTWACRALEVAADKGFISRSNDRARPEDFITKAEALAIVMSTKEYAAGASSIAVDPSANGWQSALLRRAVAADILSSGTNFGPNNQATRGEVFRWADAVKNGASESSPSGESQMNDKGVYKDFTGTSGIVKGSRNILFFHATWCPSCVALNKSLESASIPAGVVIHKVDYDSNESLRETYNVTGQHTLVEIDENGNFLRSVRGSTDINDIISDLDKKEVSANSDGMTVAVSGGNFFFEPNVIEVKVGEPVTISFTSEMGFHDWVVDEFSAATSQIQSGNTTTVTFTPDQIGEFEFYCSVGNHRAQGMVGTLKVGN